MAASDAELVRRILAGSEDAAHELVVRFQRPVLALILRMVHDRPAAEDLAQEVFIKAFRALDSFHQDRKFSSWLFKIAHNATIDALRRSSLDSVPLETPGEQIDPLTTVPAPDAESPEQAALRRDMRDSFETCLAGLRPDYREVVVLRYQEGLSYEEIAEICDLPMGTVKTHLHRARKSLARAMSELGWGPRDDGSRGGSESSSGAAKPGRGGPRNAP